MSTALGLDSHRIVSTGGWGWGVYSLHSFRESIASLSSHHIGSTPPTHNFPFRPGGDLPLRIHPNKVNWLPFSPGEWCHFYRRGRKVLEKCLKWPHKQFTEKVDWLIRVNTYLLYQGTKFVKIIISESSTEKTTWNTLDGPQFDLLIKNRRFGKYQQKY